MTETKNHSLRNFWIALGAGAVLALLLALLRGLGADRTTAENAGFLSDGFFVSGVLLAGIGGLVAISAQTDFFDMISYGFKSLAVMFTPFRRPEDHIHFYEYKQQRKEKRKGAKMFPVYAGLVLIAIAALCLLFTL